METLPDLGSLPVLSDIHFRTVVDVFSEHTSKSQVMNLDLLNVTQMSVRRKDGHASIYYLGQDRGTAPMQRQDCSHWCLPGVPDSWNEILYALILKREEAFRERNTTKISQVSPWNGLYTVTVCRELTKLYKSLPTLANAAFSINGEWHEAGS